MARVVSMVKRVLIAGGGVGGLAAGIALRRRGVEAVVLERSAQFSETGSGLVLSPNVMKAAHAITPDLAGDVRCAGDAFGAGHTSRFLTASGKTLGTVSFAGAERAWGAPIVAILCSRLHDVLIDHAGRAGVEVRSAAPVTGYREAQGSVSVTLADGAAVDGDLVIGADGLRSAVRSQLLGDGEPLYRGFTAVRGIGRAPAGQPHGFIAYGRGLILFAAAVGAGRKAQPPRVPSSSA